MGAWTNQAWAMLQQQTTKTGVSTCQTICPDMCIATAFERENKLKNDGMVAPTCAQSSTLVKRHQESKTRCSCEAARRQQDHGSAISSWSDSFQTASRGARLALGYASCRQCCKIKVQDYVIQEGLPPFSFPAPLSNAGCSMMASRSCVPRRALVKGRCPLGASSVYVNSIGHLR